MVLWKLECAVAVCRGEAILTYFVLFPRHFAVGKEKLYLVWVGRVTFSLQM
jgi:hypothetical protein